MCYGVTKISKGSEIQNSPMINTPKTKCLHMYKTGIKTHQKKGKKLLIITLSDTSMLDFERSQSLKYGAIF